MTTRKNSNKGFANNMQRKVRTRLKKSNRSVSSNAWLNRHINDIYVQQSIRDGYRSRSAYKFIEINNKYKVLAPGGPVLDLGCAPGSWIQVMRHLHPKIKIVGVDLLETTSIEGSIMLVGDIYAAETEKTISECATQYGLITSDISPNTLGIKSVDHLRIIAICERVLELAKKFLKPNGNMVCKVFQGISHKELVQNLQYHFKYVDYFKPQASRKESNEIYLIARGFINTPAAVV